MLYNPQIMKSILVTSNIDPDLDGTASGYAYAEYLTKTGKSNVNIAFLGEFHEETKFVLEKFKIKHPKRVKDISLFEEVVLVDISEISTFQGRLNPHKVSEIIDHRIVNGKEGFPKAKVQIELVGSAATLVTERYINSNLDISFESGVLLYSAIVSNTINFKSKVTTSRDKEAAKWLQKKIKLPSKYWEELFNSKSDLTGEKLLKTILHDSVKGFKVNGVSISTIQLEIMDGGKLVKERKQEIKKILGDIRKEYELKHVSMVVIDLRDLKGYILAFDKVTKEMYEKAFKKKFKSNVITLKKALMRKEIIPLIKEYI